jgi:hypothetical protein
MMKKKWISVCLSIVVCASGAQARMPERKAEVRVAQVNPGPVETTFVNCARGESLQAAIDANASPLDITISGVCVENVVIRDKDIALRGSSRRTLDGIRSVDAATPALTIRGSVLGTIENLAFSNSAGLAVSIRGASPTLANCRFESNGGGGLQVIGGAFVTAESLTFTANGSRSIGVSDAQFFCTGCDVSGNGFAVLANRGAIVSLLDSVVTGRRGIAAADAGTLADIDCVSVDTPHPCGMTVTGVAAQAFGGGTASLYGAGDFTGQVAADDRGTVELLGARQLAGAQAGQGPPVNAVDFFGMIEAAAFLDVDPPIPSRLLSTVADHFARVLVTDDTVLKGTLQCSSAADAWLDATVIVNANAVTGCEHAPAP